MLSTKYNGLLYAFLFLACLPILLMRHGKGVIAAFSAVAFTALIALLIYAPWPAINAFLTGNPLYPLFGNIFPASINGFPVPAGPPPLQHRMALYGESWVDIALIPLRMICFGADGSPKTFDGRLSPLLLLALVALKDIRRRPWILFLVLLLGFGTSLSLLLSTARARYLVSLLGPVILLSGYGIGVLVAAIPGKRVKASVYTAIVLLQAALTANYLWGPQGIMLRSGILDYLADNESPERYLKKHVGEFGLAGFVNQNLPQESLVYLILTGNRFFYYDRPVQSAGHYGAAQLVHWVRTVDGPEQLLLQMRLHSIDYLGVNTDLLTESLASALTREQALLWNSFQEQYLTLVFQDGPYSLWNVKHASRVQVP
jgi:hypothetical protein